MITLIILLVVVQGKRLVLDMLGIIVYLNEQDIEITGIIEPKPKLDIVNQSSRCLFNGEYARIIVKYA